MEQGGLRPPIYMDHEQSNPFSATPIFQDFSSQAPFHPLQYLASSYTPEAQPSSQVLSAIELQNTQETDYLAVMMSLIKKQQKCKSSYSPGKNRKYHSHYIEWSYMNSVYVLDTDLEQFQSCSWIELHNTLVLKQPGQPDLTTDMYILFRCPAQPRTSLGTTFPPVHRSLKN